MSEPHPRPVQPRCARVVDGKACNHPLSFHSGREDGPCKALGCHCPGFVAPEKDDRD